MTCRQPDGSALLAEQARSAHGLQHRLRHHFRLPVRLRSPHLQRLNDLPLPARRHCAVAQERGQHTFVPQVLAPCLELLGVIARGLPELDQGGSQAVRVEVRQPRRLECA